MQLYLDGSRVTDAGLAYLGPLTLLSVVNLNDTAITDAGPQRLANPPQVRRVYLSRAPVTDAGVHQLGNALPGARILREPDAPFPLVDWPVLILR